MPDGLSQRILHPATGAVVEDDLDTLAALEAVVDKWLRSLSPHYELRRKLRERIAEITETPAMPKRRYRTDVQARVASCPRCSRGL